MCIGDGRETGPNICLECGVVEQFVSLGNRVADGHDCLDALSGLCQGVEFRADRVRAQGCTAFEQRLGHAEIFGMV